MTDKNTNKRYHIFFAGTVQGVGFRYAARFLAQKYMLCGWIANCPDGKVELDIEGKHVDLENFLNELKQEFKTYIKNAQIEELPFGREYTDFSIKVY